MRTRNHEVIWDAPAPAASAVQSPFNSAQPDLPFSPRVPTVQ